MSTHPLYQAVREELDAHLPLGWGEALRGSLTLLVLGIMEGKSASPSGIARALGRLGLSHASVESLERRVRRIENTAAFEATVCFHPFAQHHLRLGKPRQLVLAIDPTTHTDAVVLLTISVIYRGRALPLLWEANQPLQGASFWERVAALLDAVAPLLPAGIPVIWLADRAFGTPQFTDLVQAHGWHYVVRVQGQTRCQDRCGALRSLSSLVAERGQRRKLRGLVFKKHGWRTASVVVWWGRHHPDPLCLVSDLPPTGVWSSSIAVATPSKPASATSNPLAGTGNRLRCVTSITSTVCLSAWLWRHG